MTFNNDYDHNNKNNFILPNAKDELTYCTALNENNKYFSRNSHYL